MPNLHSCFEHVADAHVALKCVFFSRQVCALTKKKNLQSHS